MKTVLYLLPSGWWSTGSYLLPEAIAVAQSEMIRTGLPHKVV